MRPVRTTALLVVIMLLVSCVPVFAHPGRTDDDGGHNGPDGYHYHHGYDAHEHVNGTCPYDFDDKTNHDGGGGVTTDNGGSSSKTAALVSKKDEATQISTLFNIAIIIVVLTTFIFHMLHALLIPVIKRRQENKANKSNGATTKMDKNIFNSIVSTYPLPMRWFRFYTTFWFVFCIIVGSVAIVAALSNNDVLIQVICIHAIFVALSAITLREVRKLTALAYKLILVHVSFWSVIITGLMMLSMFFSGLFEELFGITLTVVASTVAWIIPNYIYFKKRKSIFEGAVINPNVLAALSAAPATINTTQLQISSADEDIIIGRQVTPISERLHNFLSSNVVICIGVLGLLSLVAVLGFRSASLTNKLKAAQVEVSTLEGQKYQLEGLNEQLSSENNSLSREIVELEYFRDKAESEYSDLWDETYDWRYKSDFLDENIAFVTESGKKYHTYDCSFFQNSDSYWAYNIEAAKDNGYTPCENCH